MTIFLSRDNKQFHSSIKNLQQLSASQSSIKASGKTKLRKSSRVFSRKAGDMVLHVTSLTSSSSWPRLYLSRNFVSLSQATNTSTCFTEQFNRVSFGSKRMSCKCTRSVCSETTNQIGTRSGSVKKDFFRIFVSKDFLRLTKDLMPDSFGVGCI